MMVKFLNAEAAYLTVFGARRLLDHTGPAIYAFFEDYAIAFEPLHGAVDVIFARVLVNAARAGPACCEVGRVAQDHQKGAHILVVVIEAVVWEVRKTLRHVNIKTSSRANEVDDLTKGVPFVQDVRE